LVGRAGTGSARNAKQPTIGKLIDDAMSEIEKHNPGLKGVLPKDYTAGPRQDNPEGQLNAVLAT
jgi:hypothetical protein